MSYKNKKTSMTKLPLSNRYLYWLLSKQYIESNYTVYVHFHNKSYPPHGRPSEIPRGRGVLKVKILKAKYEAKLEFLEGKGVGGVHLWGGLTAIIYYLIA